MESKKYCCNHIQELINNGLLFICPSLDDPNINIVAIHELHKNDDGFLATGYRDEIIKITHCPICGQFLEIEDKRESKRTIQTKTSNKYQNKHLTWCTFCDKQIIALPVALKNRRHFLYLCPLCGGTVTLNLGRRLDDTTSGTIDRRHNWKQRVL